MVEKKHAVLSQRGVELANEDSMRDKFEPILSDPYDKEKNPDGWVNIGVAENFLMLEEAAEYANKKFNIDAIDLSYGQGPWGTPRLRKAFATHMNNYFNPYEPVNPNHLIISNGCGPLCEELGWVLGDPGDGILVGKPTYNAFPMDFGTKAHIKIVGTPFHGVDQFSPSGIEAYEAKLLESEKAGTKIRGIIIINPHNPLGQCYPKETLIELLKLCQKHKIHCIVDEIYACSVYSIPDPAVEPFTSVLSFDSSPYIDKDYLHVMYGMSKDLAGGGLRLGMLWTKSKIVMKALSQISVFHWSGSANERVAIAMLEDQAFLKRFLQTSCERLAKGNVLIRSILDEHGIKYNRAANAGFFMWVDLRPFLPEVKEGKDPWMAERVLMGRMAGRKVLVTNGEFMLAEEPGWFRVIFSHPEEYLMEGMRRVLEAIGVGK